MRKHKIGLAISRNMNIVKDKQGNVISNCNDIIIRAVGLICRRVR